MLMDTAVRSVSGGKVTTASLASSGATLAADSDYPDDRSTVLAAVNCTLGKTRAECMDSKHEFPSDQSAAAGCQ
jgi:hypothetical protein